MPDNDHEMPNLIDETDRARSTLPRPREITRFGSTFGTAEVEDAAEKLVAFFKLSNRWKSFTFTELMSFYDLNRWPSEEMLYGLIGPHLHTSGPFMDWCDPEPFVIHNHRHLCVTEAFIERVSKHLRELV